MFTRWRNLLVRKDDNRTKKRKLFEGVAYLLAMFCAFSMGIMYQSIQITGTLPFSLSSYREQPNIPDNIPVMTDTVAMDEFIATEKTEFENLGEHGFSCTDAALLALRDAHWKGLLAAAVSISFVDTEATHLLIGFVTEDGWRFFNPTRDGSYVEVRLQPGGTFYGHRIDEVKYMSGYDWKVIGFREVAPRD